MSPICPSRGLEGQRSRVEQHENAVTTTDKDSTAPPILKRSHAKRLREMYRSAGWPFQDVLEIELLAAGLLKRVKDKNGVDCMRVTDTGIQYLAGAAQTNRSAMSAHNALVDQVALTMARDGRIVWKNLSLRAWVEGDEDSPGRWRMCMPDVFSIRNSSKEAYLEPIVHEIKVNRADLLGDLKVKDKRSAYLDLGGQCWYVLGCNAKGKPIAEAKEVPSECGVMVSRLGSLEVLRAAPKRGVAQLPFSVWMALSKATPMRAMDVTNDTPDQRLLVNANSAVQLTTQIDFPQDNLSGFADAREPSDHPHT